MDITITLTDEELKIMANDVADPEQWIRDAVANKIHRCRERMIGKHRSPLVNKTDSELVQYILAQPGYKNGAQRHAEALARIQPPGK